MTTKLRRLGRGVYLVLAIAVASVAIMPALMQHASAAQVQSRSITMSSSVTGGAGQSYKVSFIPQAATSLGGIVVDFCAGSPLVGDTSCADPTGFTMGASPTVGSITGIGTGGSWGTASSLQCDAASGKQVLLLTNATAQAPTLAGTTPISFVISGVTNPTSLGTFYARIVTFDTAAHTTSEYTCATANQRPATFADQVDYGGVALSTVTTINITARVMEQITFCTTSWNGLSGGSCSSGSVGTNPPNITIGHGTPTSAIDSTAVDAASAYTQLSTNAGNGATIRMKTTSSTTCGGLSRDSGTTCPIPAAGASPVLFVAGTAKFGLCVVPGSGATANSPYDGSSPGTVNCADTTTPNANTSYGLDQTTSGNNVLDTYGSTIYHTTAPVNQSTSVLSFAATASLTTPAGIYTASESLVATGSF